MALYREKDLALAREILRNLLFLRPHDESLALYLEELKAVGEGLKALGEEAPHLPEAPRDLLEEDLPRFHGEHLVVVGGTPSSGAASCPSWRGGALGWTGTTRTPWGWGRRP